MGTGRWIWSFLVLCVLVLVINGCEERTVTTEKMSSSEVTLEIEEAVDAEQADAAVARAEEGSPKIVFDHLVHDFGDIAPRSKNKCEFKFTNKGTGTLKVKKKIGSTCGCTVPSLSKEEYLPGESGTIKVTYNAGRRSGKSSKHLYVYSNDKKNAKVGLTIKGNIIEKISYEPKRMNLVLNKENAGCPDITIEGKDNEKFAITRAVASGRAMTVDYDPEVKATEFVVTPKVDMDKIGEQTSGTLTIYLTHSVVDKIAIPYNILAPFKADPPTIIALNAHSGQAIKRTVYVLSNYDEPFEVEAVEAGDDFIKVEGVEELDDNRYKIDFEIIPPEQSDKRHFNSSVTVSIAGGQTLKINVIGSLPAQKT
ncbi:MAG: DUF1573 domain-containing protein [Phycisphaerales bacterium]|jgi:hypothetical protein